MIEWNVYNGGNEDIWSELRCDNGGDSVLDGRHTANAIKKKLFFQRFWIIAHNSTGRDFSRKFAIESIENRGDSVLGVRFCDFSVYFNKKQRTHKINRFSVNFVLKLNWVVVIWAEIVVIFHIPCDCFRKVDLIREQWLEFLILALRCCCCC